VNWKTRDVTDLDYTARPLITRDNKERDLQFTQEMRLASAPGAPVRLVDGVRLRWQTGVFFFSQNYDQDAINNFSPFLLSPQLGFPVAQHSPRSALNDAGAGVYGQMAATFGENFDTRLTRQFQSSTIQPGRQKNIHIAGLLDYCLPDQIPTRSLTPSAVHSHTTRRGMKMT
jgi:hypothetical protein